MQWDSPIDQIPLLGQLGNTFCFLNFVNFEKTYFWLSAFQLMSSMAWRSNSHLSSDNLRSFILVHTVIYAVSMIVKVGSET